MAARLLPGTAARVRRGRRRDLVQLQAVLGSPGGERLARFYRRMLADLRGDIYVAEDATGEIIGILSLVYARSLVRGGQSALLDGVRARRPPARALIEALVAFAEERARRRGCRRLAAWVDHDDADLRATLLARGYGTGMLLVTDLAPAAELPA
jgi:hypothetical protein